MCVHVHIYTEMLLVIILEAKRFWKKNDFFFPSVVYFCVQSFILKEKVDISIKV